MARDTRSCSERQGHLIRCTDIFEQALCPFCTRHAFCQGHVTPERAQLQQGQRAFLKLGTYIWLLLACEFRFVKRPKSLAKTLVNTYLISCNLLTFISAASSIPFFPYMARFQIYLLKCYKSIARWNFDILELFALSRTKHVSLWYHM